MALSQVQIIRSLSEALSWFEKELAWGVEPAELRHLTGRIGELYAAMITRGQMALATNQRGYDVVSKYGEHISVKTITSSNHVSFRKNTFSKADRVIVLQIVVEEGEASITDVIDVTSDEMIALCIETPLEYRYSISSKDRVMPISHQLEIVAEASDDPHRIVQYENGTITVDTDGVREAVAMPILRAIANRRNVSLLNQNGNARNTRQLGAAVLTALTLHLGKPG